MEQQEHSYSAGRSLYWCIHWRYTLCIHSNIHISPTLKIAKMFINSSVHAYVLYYLYTDILHNNEKWQRQLSSVIWWITDSFNWRKNTQKYKKYEYIYIQIPNWQNKTMYFLCTHKWQNYKENQINNNKFKLVVNSRKRTGECNFGVLVII